MARPDWMSPTIDVLKDFRTLPYQGSDTSAVNLFLLRRKYKLEIAVCDGVLFRYYHGKSDNRRGYGFPLSAGEFDAGKVFAMIEEDAKERGELRFCLCDEGQKEIVSDHFDIKWQCEPGDNDYIYEGAKWIDLAGRKYHRLKHRLNSFARTYPDAQYHPIDSSARLQDALEVARIWQLEHEDKDMPDKDLIEEMNCILEACRYWNELGFTGGVLYVDDTPVAATMAAPLGTDSIDFHFDKAISPYAAAGATVVSRSRFAASGIDMGRQYYNLEEDMNIPGLRQSKESYRPLLKYPKYYGRVSL